jgi:tRNA(Ile)-lysidine synthase
MKKIKNKNLNNLNIQTKQSKERSIQKSFSQKISRTEQRYDLFLLYKINNVIIEHNLLQPDQRILIAVSGGQDSICLLRVLVELKKKWNWKLGLIHCDHRWTSNSKFQAEHVAFLAGNLQINYHQAVAIESVQQEGTARIWRYDIIKNIALSNNYTAIITGHNASDRIETLLYNLTRGSGLHGLQSIRWKRSLYSFIFTQSAISKKNSSFFFKKLKYKKMMEGFFFLNKKKLYLIRPFLETTRTEIRNLLDFWHFPSWPDESNKELRISRNRIRHRLVPYIRLHYNLKIDQTLARWAEIVQSETFYIDQLTNYILSKIESKKNTYSLPSKGKKKNFYKNFYQSAISIDLLRSLPLAIQRRVLKQYIYKITGRILGFEYVEQIRLSCLFQSSLSSNFSLFSLDLRWQDLKKKKKFVTPWIIFPGGIKILIKNNYLFFFYPLFFSC